MTRRRSLFAQLSRDAYKVSKWSSYANAASKGPGPLAKAVITRKVHRKEIGLLRRGRLW